MRDDLEEQLVEYLGLAYPWSAPMAKARPEFKIAYNVAINRVHEFFAEWSLKESKEKVETATYEEIEKQNIELWTELTCAYQQLDHIRCNYPDTPVEYQVLHIDGDKFVTRPPASPGDFKFKKLAKEKTGGPGAETTKP